MGQILRAVKYYRGYIVGFNELVEPFETLLESGQFEWTRGCDRAFIEITRQITEMFKINGFFILK